MQFQSIQGPTDPNRRHSLTEGYQPVSRIGETVINCFVDAYEFAALDNSITHLQLTGEREDPDPALAAGAYEPGKDIEVKPHFHEWASVLPGMICLSRKARNSTFRNYVAAETATPVIGCAACPVWRGSRRSMCVYRSMRGTAAAILCIPTAGRPLIKRARPCA